MIQDIMVKIQNEKHVGLPIYFNILMVFKVLKISKFDTLKVGDIKV